MKKILVALCVLAFSYAAQAQTPPNWTQGFVPTPAQWNAVFAGKQDFLGAAPLLVTGGTMTGELVTAPSTAISSGFNLAPGVAPTSPINGDLWATSTGVFTQVNGATISLTGATSASFAATTPITVSFSSGVVTYACATCGVIGSPLSQFASTTSAQLRGILSDETGTGLAVFQNGALGIATATSINGITITPSSGTLTLNTNTLAVSGAGLSLTLTPTAATNATFPVGNVTLAALNVAQTFSTLQTYSAGINSNTLALGGATIGSNALSVNGSSSLTGSTQIASTSANAFFVTTTAGSTGPVPFNVDASTASLSAGLNVKGAVAGGTVRLSVIDSATNSALGINAKGNGSIVIGDVSTGPVNIGAAGGGLTVSNSFTATGLVTFADMATAAVATSGQFISGAANVLVPSSVIYTTQTIITFGATTTFDFSTFINANVTLTGNITTMSVANVKNGQAGSILFQQDGTGGRTTVWNNIFKFAGGVTPALSTTPNTSDVLFYNCVTTTFCEASLVQNMK